MKDHRPRCVHRLPRAFTLLEILIVIGLVAMLSTVLVTSLFGGGKGAALQSAQATLASMVTAARAQAISNGQGARLCLNVDPTVPDRFLRYWVAQVKEGAVWRTTFEVYLPDGVFVVPGKFSDLPAGLFSAASSWLKSDRSTPLRSSAFRSDLIFTAAINETGAEKWVAIELGATGGTAQAGDVVLVPGIRRVPGSYAASDSPIELRNPEAARGLTVSSYGVPALVNELTSF